LRRNRHGPFDDADTFRGFFFRFASDGQGSEPRVVRPAVEESRLERAWGVAGYGCGDGTLSF